MSMVDLTYDTKKHAELLEMIDKKKTQRAELEEQIQALNESLVSLADKYERYVTELPGMRKEREALNTEINSMTEQLATTQDEYQRLLAQKRPHHDLTVELQQLRMSVEIAKREKEDLETLNHETKEQVKRAEQQVRIKSTRVTELKEEIASLERLLDINAQQYRRAEDMTRNIDEKKVALQANILENKALLDELALQNLGVGGAVRKIQAALDKKGVKFDAMKALQA